MPIKSELITMLRFYSVGASGIGVNMGVFALLTYGLKYPYLPASIGAQVVALTTNFALDKYFTFRNFDVRPSRILAQYGAFAISCALGMAIATATLYVLVHFRECNKALAQMVGIAAGSITNYFFSRKWTFKVSV
jgi:dolichol-phosphate mannosyltransferase